MVNAMDGGLDGRWNWVDLGGGWVWKCRLENFKGKVM
jgi:hypothetical protein